jgi:hypothetical protein
MPHDLKQTLVNVINAMENLNNQYEAKIEELRKGGKDEEELQKLVKGAMAMKDASGIYLSWSNHFVERLGQIEGLDQDDEESIISEH